MYNSIRVRCLKLLLGKKVYKIIRKYLIFARWVVWDINDYGNIGECTLERTYGKLNDKDLNEVLDKLEL